VRLYRGGNMDGLPLAQAVVMYVGGEPHRLGL
jgi:hypothetical protein